MALIANQLRKQVDLPVWEWLRFSPVVPTSGLSCSCSADNSLFNETSGRYIYYLLNSTNFWRYDTIADTYEQLASPPYAPASSTTMRFAGAQGYHNRVITATTNTFTTGLPFGGSATGFKVRILSGKGAGQERTITSVSDSIVADYGSATAGTVTNLTDTAKTWTTGYIGTTLNVNGWVGYSLRTLFGSGLNQVRKIIYNTSQILTTGDINFVQNDPFANNTFTITPAAGTMYQIESNLITVDSAWDVIPDNTSRFVIQSGGIWLVSGVAAAPFYSMQYYDILHDMWYSKPALQNMISIAPTDNSIERMTENSSLWAQNKASSGSLVSMVDLTTNWTVNQWAGYQVYISSGTGRGQIATIISNTSNTLSYSTLTTAPDSTSYYQIVGFDGGKSSGSNTGNTLSATAKAWTVNRWANYAVRIIFGTGAGQLRQILSNTSNSLTIVGLWNILPDTTSVFAIQGASETLLISWGGLSELYMHNAGNTDMLSHGRITESGVASVAAALLSDSNHTIYEQMPFSISSLVGTTTITATTSQSHNFKVGQYVSIRGVTSAAADQYNITGLVQIVTVPSITTFTYAPSAAGTGTYTYLTALSTTNLSDASKDYRDNALSATNTTITFARITPTNINGWYATGTNITPGTTVVSGAGTITLTLSNGAAIPSGVIQFTPWGPTTLIQSTYSSGGGLGVATVTMAATTSSNITGWYVTGTGIAIGSTVTSGAGTATITLSNACTGVVSGVISFYPPSISGRQIAMSLAAPLITSGSTTSQLMQATSSGLAGATIGFITTLGAAPVAGLTRYIVANKELIGAALDQTTTTYNAGVATAGATTTLTDASAVWATATGTGTAQTTTITLSAAAPGNVTGWYVTGTGINTGAIIVSGAGTTTLTLSVAHNATVSGVITCAAWNQSLVGRRLKIQSGATGLNQEVIITAVTPTTGTLTFGAVVAPLANIAVYSLLSIPLKGPGHEISWIPGNRDSTTRGKYLWMPRGGISVGFDKLDLTTDRIIATYLTPYTETLTSGSMFSYDGGDRLYFTKDITQRVYYVDVNTNWVHGAGVFPYIAGTASIGNRMEIFQTVDGLNYLWLNRHLNQEHFRQLLFF